MKIVAVYLLSVQLLSSKVRASNFEARSPISKALLHDVVYTQTDVASTTAALSIPRGGAISRLDPIVMTKVSTVLSGAFGLYLNVAPKKAGDIFGLMASENTPMAVWIARQVGTGLLGWSIAAYLLVTQQISVYQAYQVCNVLLLYEYLRFWLNDETKALGFEMGPMHAGAIFVAFTIFAMYQDYANLVLKVTFIEFLLEGGAFIVAPLKILSVLGYRGATVNEKILPLFRTFGHGLLAVAVLQGSIIWGATPQRAFGYSSLVWLLHHLGALLLEGEYKKAKTRNARLFWIVLDVLACASTLL